MSGHQKGVVLGTLADGLLNLEASLGPALEDIPTGVHEGTTGVAVCPIGREARKRLVHDVPRIPYGAEKVNLFLERTAEVGYPVHRDTLSSETLSDRSTGAHLGHPGEGVILEGNRGLGPKGLRAAADREGGEEEGEDENDLVHGLRIPLPDGFVNLLPKESVLDLNLVQDGPAILSEGSEALLDPGPVDTGRAAPKSDILVSGRMTPVERMKYHIGSTPPASKEGLSSLGLDHPRRREPTCNIVPETYHEPPISDIQPLGGI